MIKEIYIENVRNISRAAINPSPILNVFIGDNGSGKSTVLEGLYLLSTGRSFRTVELTNLIKFETESILVRGKINQSSKGNNDKTDGIHKLGFSFSRRKEKVVKIDGEKIRNSSELAKCLPLKFLSPLEGELIEGSPGLRRKYIDWLMFHVEQPVYLDTLKSFKTVLSNRNATLRKNDRAQEPYWRKQFVNLSEELARITETKFTVFCNFLEEQLCKVLPGKCFKIEFYKGWREDSSLESLLTGSIDTDFKAGSTRFGYQRSDLKIRIDDKPAAQVLSRGQMKLCAMVLQLAQIKYLKTELDIQCVVLIDDVIAELDDSNVCAIVDEFIKSDSQCFITSANEKLADLLGREFGDFFKLFHVEHGTIKEEEE